MFQPIVRFVPVVALCLIAAMACKKQEAPPPAPAPTASIEQPGPAPTTDSTAPAQPGPMANPMMACAGIAGTKCTGATEYCHMPDGKCTMADASGTCESKPATCPTVSAPVCGCDGKTYDNACKAGMAGISISANGACK
jgi:hypothetical protein